MENQEIETEELTVTTEETAAQNENKEEKGASLVEYALLVALIAVACIVAIRALGSKISQQFSAVASIM